MRKNDPYPARRGGRKAVPVRGGFTLIELMVVLAIMALLVGMIVPSAVSAMRRNDANVRGGELMELLRFGQRYAVTSHRPVQANLDSRRNLCWISVIRTNLPWLEEAEASEGSTTRTLATLKLPREYHLTVQSDPTGSGSGEAWDTITFKSDGRSDDAMISLSDGVEKPFEIMVFGSNGSIQQQEAPF